VTLQTFLPFPEFAASARALDPRRLGKQRVEALQVLRALTTPGYGWRHHPAVLMWKGHEEALGSYGVTVCRAWFVLGFADTCELKLREESSLLRKDPGFYRPMFPDTPDDLPYVWPVRSAARKA